MIAPKARSTSPALATSLLTLSLVGIWAARSMETAAAALGGLLTPELSTAGGWLEDHNTGGTHVASPA